MDIDSRSGKDERRADLERELDIRIPSIASVAFEGAVHCENLVGGTTLPLGIAGPLRVRRGKAHTDYIIPLATTEGALVASVNRGCKAIMLSGGASVRSELIGVTRAPVFETASLEQSFELRDWLEQHTDKLRSEAGKTSSHLRLMKFDTKIIGRNVFVRFYFDTGDAMGMNMATIASERLVRYIEKRRAVKCLALSGNYCVDKKPSFLNFITGRGRSVWAEAAVPGTVLKAVLKTDAYRFMDVWHAKSVTGSMMSGTVGNNAHFANIVAAFYAATGQDLAHVVEGSLGSTMAMPEKNGGLYFSVHLPAVLVGTVGGGTKLGIKKEALSILGVKTSAELSEALAAAVLAGELSLLSSLAEGTLAQAHSKLGR